MDWHIRLQNEEVTSQCLLPQKKLKVTGLRFSIFKSQAISQLYGSLFGIRNSGDIDVYVDCCREKAIEYARLLGDVNPDWDYKHIILNVFTSHSTGSWQTGSAQVDDVDVEMHYRVEVFLNLWVATMIYRAERHGDSFGGIQSVLHLAAYLKALTV